jgi:Tol biopolymer transport system component
MMGGGPDLFQCLKHMHKQVIVSLLFLIFFSSYSFLPGFAQSKPERLLSEDYDVWSCDWSSTGRLVFSGKPKGENGMALRVWLYNFNKKDPIPWTGTGSLIDLSPKWAPDGSGVVMIRRLVTSTDTQGLPSAVWWKAFPSGEGLQLTSGPWDADPAWAPDGKKVVFVRGDGPHRTALAVVGRDGGKVKNLTPVSEAVISTPCWGKDGRIYFTRIERKTGKSGIYVLNPTTGQERVLLRDEDDHRFPVLSPQGRYLAYVSTRGLAVKENKLIMDRGVLYVRDLKTGREHKVTEGVSMNGAPPVWSPDGKKLVFFSFRSKRPAMWVVKWDGK